MRRSALVVSILAIPMLAACGSTKEDRTLGGAALGAAFGSALGIAFGPVGIGSGAAIGAVAGSTTGAFTDEEQVNYGQPIWRQDIMPDIRSD